MRWFCASWASSDIPTVSAMWRFASTETRACSCLTASAGLSRTAVVPSGGSRGPVTSIVALAVEHFGPAVEDVMGVAVRLLEAEPESACHPY